MGGPLKRVRQYKKGFSRVRIATSAVTPGATRQRTSLDSERFSKFEGRRAAPPSGYDRNAATISLVWPACPDLGRDGALPWTSASEVPAGVHPKEFFSCRKNWLYRRPRTSAGSPFWKKDS
jgi:hypothetical protein